MTRQLEMIKQRLAMPGVSPGEQQQLNLKGMQLQQVLVQARQLMLQQSAASSAAVSGQAMGLYPKPNSSSAVAFSSAPLASSQGARVGGGLDSQRQAMLRQLHSVSLEQLQQQKTELVRQIEEVKAQAQHLQSALMSAPSREKQEEVHLQLQKVLAVQQTCHHQLLKQQQLEQLKRSNPAPPSSVPYPAHQRMQAQPSMNHTTISPMPQPYQSQFSQQGLSLQASHMSSKNQESCASRQSYHRIK